jgi:hypothetical protein
MPGPQALIGLPKGGISSPDEPTAQQHQCARRDHAGLSTERSDGGIQWLKKVERTADRERDDCKQWGGPNGRRDAHPSVASF